MYLERFFILFPIRFVFKDGWSNGCMSPSTYLAAYFEDKLKHNTYMMRLILLFIFCQLVMHSGLKIHACMYFRELLDLVMLHAPYIIFIPFFIQPLRQTIENEEERKMEWVCIIDSSSRNSGIIRWNIQTFQTTRAKGNTKKNNKNVAEWESL